MKPNIKAVETDEEAPEEVVPTAPPTAFHGFAEKIGSRNLMIAIVTMPLFFIGLLVLIIAVVGLPEEEVAAPVLDDTIGVSPVVAAPTISQTPVSQPDPVAADVLPVIPPGGIALDGDRLAVRIETPEGPVVHIYDLTTNEIVQTVTVPKE